MLETHFAGKITKKRQNFDPSTPQKLKQYVTTKPPLQRILQGILHTESENQLNHEKTGSTKPQEKKKQDSRE
jgi:hypothetical protein